MALLSSDPLIHLILRLLIWVSTRIHSTLRLCVKPSEIPFDFSTLPRSLRHQPSANRTSLVSMDRTQTFFRKRSSTPGAALDVESILACRRNGIDGTEWRRRRCRIETQGSARAANCRCQCDSKLQLIVFSSIYRVSVLIRPKPYVPTAHTQAAVYTVAERASAMIRDHWKL